MDPEKILNIAAYKFAPLAGLEALRDELMQMCHVYEVRGTVLLSPEGINLFLAGTAEGIAAVLEQIRQIPGLADLQTKDSFTADRPFDKIRVRIKKEIIAFGIDGVEPAKYTSRRVTADQLKSWLDNGKPVTLLDTRNNYEVTVGSFTNAVPIDIDDFRTFPQAVARLPEDLKLQPIVTFCTGGIRCEKAAPYLEQQGFQDVYQLDGGILNYFEKCGRAHFTGDCWVFDQRGAVDAGLNATGVKQCDACNAIVFPEEQASPDFIVGVSCPKCAEGRRVCTRGARNVSAIPSRSCG